MVGLEAWLVMGCCCIWCGFAIALGFGSGVGDAA